MAMQAQVEKIEYKERCEELEEVLSIIAENVPVGLWRLDPNGKLTYANKEFCNMFGRSFKELQDKKFYKFFCPEDRNHKERDCMTSWIGSTGNTSLRIMLPNKKVRWVQIKYNSLDHKGIVGIMFDITPEKEILPELLRFKEELRSQ